MKKEIRKLTKEEKQKIENKLLTIFATALGSIMVLMYLMNWFQGSAGFVMASRIIIYAFMVGFIGFAIFAKIREKHFLLSDRVDSAKKCKNWFIFSIVGLVCAFFVYPTEIIGGLFNLVRLNGVGLAIITFINKFSQLGNGPIATRIVLLMYLIGAYTIGVYIYFGIKTRRAHKSSLNKGAKTK